MYQQLNLPDIRNVVAGALAVLNVPVGGPTIDAIILNLTNITSAQLDNIRVKLNGKEIMFFEDAALLQDMNDYYGRAAVANQYIIPFHRPELTELLQEKLTGIGTMGLQTLTVEMEIDAACVGPAITARAMISEPRPLGVITKVKRIPYNFSASGQVECNSIPFGPNVLAMHFKKSDVTHVHIEDGSIPVVQNMPKADLEGFQKHHGRVPQTGFTHVDFCLKGTYVDALETSQVGQDKVRRVRPLRVLPTLGTSGALGLYVEYLDEFAGL